MAIQLASNISVRLVRETTTGTAALVGATPCHVLRLTASPGLELKRAQIQSQELRDDGQRTLGRLGHKTVEGSYNGELTVGGATDMIAEAIMRSTWVASALKFTCDAGAAHTSLAFTANTATLAGTDTFTVTHGVKVGDVVRFGAVGTTVDNINCLVVGVAAQVLTFAGSPLAVVAADTNATFTILKKLTTPTTPTRWSHTVEQYDEDTDLSELFLGCRVTGFKVSCKPGAMATYSVTFMGMDRTLLVTGTSPWFTTPTTTTGLGLISDDSSIWVNGAVAAYVTGFDLDFTIGAQGEAVLGTFVSPDIFDNIASVTGTITAMRTSFANPILFDAETEFEVGILLQEPGAVPRGCFSIYLPRVKIAALSAAVGGDSGPKVEVCPLQVGVKVASTGYDATIANLGSSAS
jgi:hypothetical protein